MPGSTPAGLGPLPAFGNTINPMSVPVPGSPEAALSPSSSIATDLSPTPQKGGKKGIIFGALFGMLALAAAAVYTGRLVIPGVDISALKKFKSMAPAVGDNSPAPAPAPLPMPVHAPPAAPVPLLPQAVDPRETAIDAAKEWELPDGRMLGQVIETLSPPVGNLSPWMAEPAADNRFAVNYFAEAITPGAPTVAYKFEVNLTEKTVVGRNAAAKAVLTGKAVAPPAPPKPKPVKIKPKSKPKAKPKEAAPKNSENLDSLLSSPASSKDVTAQADPAAPEAAPEAPPEDAPPANEPPAAPANPTTAKRAAKAAKTAAPTDQPPAGKAADESLLDDLLKE
jgi:hypothetical protein